MNCFPFLGAKENDKVVRLFCCFPLSSQATCYPSSKATLQCQQSPLCISVFLAEFLALNPEVSYGNCPSFISPVNAQIVHAATTCQEYSPIATQANSLDFCEICTTTFSRLSEKLCQQKFVSSTYMKNILPGI